MPNTAPEISSLPYSLIPVFHFWDDFFRGIPPFLHPPSSNPFLVSITALFFFLLLPPSFALCHFSRAGGKGRGGGRGKGVYQGKAEAEEKAEFRSSFQEYKRGKGRREEGNLNNNAAAWLDLCHRQTGRDKQNAQSGTESVFRGHLFTLLSLSFFLPC